MSTPPPGQGPYGPPGSQQPRPGGRGQQADLAALYEWWTTNSGYQL